MTNNEHLLQRVKQLENQQVCSQTGHLYVPDCPVEITQDLIKELAVLKKCSRCGHVSRQRFDLSTRKDRAALMEFVPVTCID